MVRYQIAIEILKFIKNQFPGRMLVLPSYDFNSVFLENIESKK